MKQKWLQMIMSAFGNIKNLKLFIALAVRAGFAEIPLRNMGYRVPYPKTKDSKRPIIEHTFAWINAFKSLKTICKKKLSNLYENSYLAFSLIQSRLFKTIDFKKLIKNA